LVTEKDALPGRKTPLQIAQTHLISGNPTQGPWPEHCQVAVFGMGCFWGVERLFWQQPGVYSTAVGYLGGFTENPTYEEVCTGLTGHNEVVQVVFDPQLISYKTLLNLFWETHDPTQGMRQGNDTGTQYRSGIYTCSDSQKTEATESRNQFQEALKTQGYGAITTEIETVGDFYYAEDYHQQYLAKNPGGYCNLAGTGIRCAV